MGLRPVILYPDPILRTRCPEVERFDADLAGLASDMIETMHAAPGIGLAAPQVGEIVRLAVVDLSVGKEPSALRVLVNPRLLAGEGRELDEEGCLSIPGLTDKVERAFRARIAAQNLAGEPFEVEAEGLLARAICHEIDHLDGVLFIDRLRGLRRELAMRRLRKQLQRAGVEPERGRVAAAAL